MNERTPNPEPKSKVANGPAQPRSGFSDENQPTWAPPEYKPEPPPSEPVLNNRPENSNPSPKTNSPA